MNKENPFENKKVAEQWIKSVEGETGLIRDTETYPRLHDWFENTSKGIVIDIGSGQGICSSKIDNYSHYIGVEPSYFLLERANELYKSTQTNFLTGNAYALPVTENSCDNAFSINVWFHLDDLSRASQELSRVLKIGGKFFIHTADSDAFDLWKKFYINPIIDGKKILGEVKVPVNNMTMSTFYLNNNSEIVEALEKEGLKVLSMTKIGNLQDNRTIFLVIEGEKR